MVDLGRPGDAYLPPAALRQDAQLSMLECFFSQAYAFELQERGVHAEHIRCYGFAFQGKRVLIG